MLHEKIIAGLTLEIGEDIQLQLNVLMRSLDGWG